MPDGPAFPPHDHAARRDRLRPRLEDAGAGALYVTGAANIAYLTGFTGSHGQVVVGLDAASDVLLTDPRYEGRAQTESPDVAIRITREPVRVMWDATAGTVAFEGDHLTYRRATELQLDAGSRSRTMVASQGWVEALRQRKDPSEIARLQHACDITVAAFAAVLEELVPGRTERELARDLERRFVDRGADGLAFDPIVASGPNGAVPHHEPTDRPIEVGELVTFDIGARVQGYHADFTRTVAVGRPPPGWTRLHALVVAAQQAAVAAAVADATCEQVDQAGRAVIEAAGHAEQFLHGIGHGVGLQIHEAPIVSAQPTATLCPSMAMTVEPGIYLRDDPIMGRPAGGVRIEDTVIVSPHGAPRNLTAAPHDLVVLPT